MAKTLSEAYEEFKQTGQSGHAGTDAIIKALVENALGGRTPTPETGKKTTGKQES